VSLAIAVEKNFQGFGKNFQGFGVGPGITGPTPGCGSAVFVIWMWQRSVCWSCSVIRTLLQGWLYTGTNLLGRQRCWSRNHLT